jgi:hypothetical protein
MGRKSKDHLVPKLLRKTDEKSPDHYPNTEPSCLVLTWHLLKILQGVVYLHPQQTKEDILSFQSAPIQDCLSPGAVVVHPNVGQSPSLMVNNQINITTYGKGNNLHKKSAAHILLQFITRNTIVPTV